MQVQEHASKRSWLRSAADLSAAILLFSCLISAIVLLGMELLREGDSSLQAVSENPLTFDVPALAVTKENIDQHAGRSASRPLLQPSGEVVVLDDWSYTAIVRGRPQPSKHHRHHHH